MQIAGLSPEALVRSLVYEATGNNHLQSQMPLSSYANTLQSSSSVSIGECFGKSRPLLYHRTMSFLEALSILQEAAQEPGAWTLR